MANFFSRKGDKECNSNIFLKYLHTAADFNTFKSEEKIGFEDHLELLHKTHKDKNFDTLESSKSG